MANQSKEDARSQDSGLDVEIRPGGNVQEPPPEVRETLAMLERNKGAMELLRFLNDQVLREQEIYWQRFYAFATLHAGAFVLATSNSLRYPKAIAAIGIVLALTWLYVQWLSLYYADRAKPRYHDMRKWLRIDYEHNEGENEQPSLREQKRDERQVAPWKKWILIHHWASSTDVGLLVTIVVFICWVLVFFYLYTPHKPAA